MSRQGLLLVNLGTPDAPEPGAVRRYLDEFLSDPRVLDINPIARWMLLKLVILPRRSKESAEAYQTVWTDRGSPLLFHGLDLRDGVRSELGDSVPVELGMRYQNPSIGAALKELRNAGVDEVVVFPLFPQYSSAAWGSAVEKVFDEASRYWNVPSLQVVPPYYDHPAFIESFRKVAEPVLEEARADRILFSYHGLPERHIHKGDDSGRCLKSADCCASIGEHNRNCYRAQCFATTHALAAALGLDKERWEITFQSRLGKDPWIQPFTDVVIEDLAASGVKRLAVFSPAFTADCLETLEELQMRAREDFIERGGEELVLIPSLNSEDHWVRAVLEITHDAVGKLGPQASAQPQPSS